MLRFPDSRIDNTFKWDHHISELTRSFKDKLNLLKSLYFLPRQARTDFYFGVICPLLRMVCWFGALEVKWFSQNWNLHMSETQK